MRKVKYITINNDMGKRSDDKCELERLIEEGWQIISAVPAYRTVHYILGFDTSKQGWVS